MGDTTTTPVVDEQYDALLNEFMSSVEDLNAKRHAERQQEHQAKAQRLAVARASGALDATPEARRLANEIYERGEALRGPLQELVECFGRLVDDMTTTGEHRDFDDPSWDAWWNERSYQRSVDVVTYLGDTISRQLDGPAFGRRDNWPARDDDKVSAGE